MAAACRLCPCRFAGSRHQTDCRYTADIYPSIRVVFFLRIEPDYADAYYNLGNALVKQGNLTKGIYHFFEALGLQPDNVKALNNMAAARVFLERYPEP